MTDLERFEAFFKEMGVVCGTRSIRQREWANAPEAKQTRFILSVTQNHFHFDDDQRYLGSEADEMGYFVPRAT